MRDAFTNFGNIAITAAATEASKAVKSENIIDLVAKSKLEAGLHELRFVFCPKASYTGTITFQVAQSDTITSNELASPVITDTFTVTNPTANKKIIKPFVLENQKKYMQIFAFGSAGTALSVESWLEFGEGA